MWVKCPDGAYRLDCALENAVPKYKAKVKITRDQMYQLSIPGFGSFWDPKTLKQIDLILAHHGLWPFQETSDQCPSFPQCQRKLAVAL